MGLSAVQKILTNIRNINLRDLYYQILLDGGLSGVQSCSNSSVEV
jgi:hypothetical protein